VAALLLVGASALPMLAGWGGRTQSALAAMPAGSVAGDAPASTPPLTAATAAPAVAPQSVASAALGSSTGAIGLDPLDLVGKGVIVAALLYLTLRALRWLQAGPAVGTHRLEVLETRPLGPKASLHLVAVGERRLVVGLTPGGMVSIAELDAAELAAAELAAPAFTAAPVGARDMVAVAGEGAAIRARVRGGWAGATHAPWSRAMAAIRGVRPDAGRRGAAR
jgi:flagellar biogenesis protein FliO